MLDPTVIGPGGRDQRRRPLLRTMVGDVLRRNRREQGRTLADVARAAKVSMPYLSEVERGRKEASSEVLAAICDSLHIDLSDLLAEVGRDLVDRRVSQAQVVRLGAIRDLGHRDLGHRDLGQRGLPQRHGPADAPRCLLAA